MGANYIPFEVQAGKRFGYGQIEPNHLSAQRTGQFYAQLPCVDTITQLENGQFVKYDYANGVVNLTGEGEWMLVFNEIKLYDEREQMTKDFVQTPDVDGKIVPRVCKTNIGDIFTTNTLDEASTSNYAYTNIDTTKNYYVVNADGFLEGAAAIPAAGICFKKVATEVVGSANTMPDGQPAVKLQRIQ